MSNYIEVTNIRVLMGTEVEPLIVDIQCRHIVSISDVANRPGTAVIRLINGDHIYCKESRDDVQNLIALADHAIVYAMDDVEEHHANLFSGNDVT